MSEASTSAQRQTPRSSVSNSSTAREQDDQSSGRTRQDPSEKHMKRAGIAAAAIPGAGIAGASMLACGGKPPGTDMAIPMEEQMDDKHHAWSGHIAKERRSAIKKVLLLFAFITAWMWVCLPIFWGSTYKLESNFHNLGVHLVSFDNDADAYLNEPMYQMVQKKQQSKSSLGWSVRPESDYPDGIADVKDNVLSQKSWATVVIHANATSAWRNAVENGDSSYYPQGAITIYLESARFYQVTLLYIEALIMNDMVEPLSTARNNALQAFIGGTGSVASAAAVPQAIGVGFGYSFDDLRRIGNGEWSGAAPMEAALIYYVIFAFYLAMFAGIARMKSGLGNRLQFRSMMALRLGWPLLAYFFVSLWFTLIERAWQVPISAWLGSGGFPALWALNYVTLIAAGFAMETALAVVGIPWLPFFLILWLILNITSSFYPIALMPRFYRFLRWAPFLHNVEGYKIIAYGTNLQHRLGKHFGILFGLIGVETIFLPLAIGFERWFADRKARKAQLEKEKESE